MESKSVLCEINDGLALVIINNRPVNALTENVISDLDEVIGKLSKNQTVRVVIITGSGDKAFVAGADIKQFLTIDAVKGKELALRRQQIFAKLSRLSQPVIAAIHGFALGGGCEMALACDIRIAGEDAFIGLPEVGLGVIPGYGGTQRLPRLIGAGRAMSMIFTGDPVSAAEAFRIGLVDKVVPKGEVLNEAKAIAQKIMTRGPLAVQAVKRVVYEGLKMPLEEGITFEANQFGELCSTEDQKEGANAFLSKRKPNFQGK